MYYYMLLTVIPQKTRFQTLTLL